MIGSEENELGVGEKIGIWDIVYESRFFIVNLLGIIGFVWIGYELLAGLRGSAPTLLWCVHAGSLSGELLLEDVLRHRIPAPLFLPPLL